MPNVNDVTADVLRDYMAGRLNDFETRRIERASRADAEIRRAFEMIRGGMDLLRDRLQLPTEIPTEWLAIIGRWEIGEESRTDPQGQ